MCECNPNHIAKCVNERMDATFPIFLQILGCKKDGYVGSYIITAMHILQLAHKITQFCT